MLFEFLVIKENFCGLFSLWPWIYSVGSHFALFFMYSRNLQLDKKWLFWWSVNLKSCLQSLLPLRPISWSQLVPESPVDDLLPKSIYGCFLWLNFLFIIEILPSFIVWNSMNQSLWQNSEYRQISRWAIVHYFLTVVENGMYQVDNVCFCLFLFFN